MGVGGRGREEDQGGGGGGFQGRWGSEGDGEDLVVEIAGNEGVGVAVDEAAHGGDEGPTQDGGDRDGIAKGDAHG
eukprot:scaffold6243_cov115-Amphora_coffeaeformis.AAC.1